MGHHRAWECPLRSFARTKRRIVHKWSILVVLHGAPLPGHSMGSKQSSVVMAIAR